MPKFYRAKESRVVVVDGEQLPISKGEFARAGHPIIKVAKDLWEPVDSIGRFDVEQATKAPGEKRKASRPRKSKPRKSKPKAAKKSTGLTTKDMPQP